MCQHCYIYYYPAVMPGSQDSKLRVMKIAQQLTESLFNNVTVRKKQGNSESGWGFWKEDGG